MKGLMQPFPLNLAHVLEHAASVHGRVEVVSNTVEGGLHRYTYADVLRRTKQLANALHALGLEPDDRVATLAWNGYRHLEAWYAIAGSGMICHTVNPRLFPEQIKYIVNHAQDRALLTDLSFVPLLEKIADQLHSVERYVVLTDAAHMPETTLPDAICYEELLAAQPQTFDWPVFSEETASSLCYTSGTTGNPKGVLYSHRGNILQAFAAISAEGFALTARSTVLMVVPMFHANSWSLTYSAPMVGAKLVLPGPHLDGASTQQLIVGEGVTFSAAVPTVWNMLLAYLRESAAGLGELAEVAIGGAAVPRSMIETFNSDYGVTVLHAWGMTEMSPLGTINRPTAETARLSANEQTDLACKQGRPAFAVEMCIKDDNGKILPHDGESAGHLLVRGPWIIQRYYGAEEDCVDDDGWFDTGDIATIDEYGYMQITDRAKDIIKSGGEWISSVDLENAAVGHPAVQLAAVIGKPDPRWDERPLLILKLNDGAAISLEEMQSFLAGKVAKWWIPEEIAFAEEIPLTATGKINKVTLRERFL
jgi:fatty-acyl-CoA synthase